MSIHEILKWVGLVFLAGFIGFFGKYLGRVVLSLMQRKSPLGPAASSMEQAVKRQGTEAQGVSRQQEPSVKVAARQEEKLLKKALKARAKEKKKSDG